MDKMMSLGQNSTASPQKQIGAPRGFVAFPNDFLIKFSTLFSLLLLVFMAGALAFPGKTYVSTGVGEQTPEIFEATPPPAFGCDPANSCCQAINDITNAPPVCHYLKARLGNGAFVENVLNVPQFPATVSFQFKIQDTDSSCQTNIYNDLERYELDYGNNEIYTTEIASNSSCATEGEESGFISGTGSFTYQTQGTYTATITVFDREGESNECSIIIQPQPVTPQHYACTTGGSCELTNGEGDDQCDPDVENVCRHLICQTNSCAYENIPGPNTGGCTTELQQCGVLPKHYTCTSGACTQVDGAGNDECNPATPNICKHLTCQTNSCAYENIPGPNTGGCTTEFQQCGEIPPTVKSCETVTIAFENDYTTHYVGDKVFITAKGTSDHANGVTSFKFRFGPAGATTVTCGKTATTTPLCNGITANADGSYQTTLTYTIVNTGAFEVYGSACDDTGCSEFSN